MKALTHPSTQDYEEIANDTPADGNGKAYTWIFVASVIASVINIVGNIFTQPRISSNAVPGFQVFSLLSLVCIPVQGFLTILSVVIFVGITQFFAQHLGGTGTYPRLLYTTAAYYAPLAIVTGIIGAIPYVSLLNLVLGIYAFYLQLLSVKTVNGFGWGKAFLSAYGLWIAIVVVIAIIFIILLTLAGPSFGNIYSNTIRTLQPQF